MVPRAYWVGQQYSEAVGTGSNPVPKFFNLDNTTENRDAPSLMRENFPDQKFSETEKGSSTKCFGTVRRKLFDGKS